MTYLTSLSLVLDCRPVRSNRVCFGPAEVGALIDSMRCPRSPPERKFLTYRKGTPEGLPAQLLNHDLLLLRIYTALRILRCDGDHALAGRQGRGKVVKTAICGHNRDFPSIHHDPRSGLGLPSHFNHVPMLNQRVDFQIDRHRVLALGDDGEAVLLAFHRLFPITV